jgi:hypothetical protein
MLLPRRRHLAVQKLYSKVREHVLGKTLPSISGSFDIAVLLSVCDPRIDKVCLFFRLQALADELVCLAAILAVNPAGDDNASARRGVLDNRDIQVAKGCHSQRARDGCSRHYQIVRRGLLAQLCTLVYSEFVLLVNHHQAQLPVPTTMSIWPLLICPKSSALFLPVNPPVTSTLFTLLFFRYLSILKKC